ncbi:hypothetical protein TIFTF001_034518 [Ficus carica]|uniref:Uncharacterized protein n=1 Tax=Ficus carica TaxID=3494 RepID=A0AA88J8P1_FICCA|nr:hypothetical protein TIFTF001_034518 [Ficus carica]
MNKCKGGRFGRISRDSRKQFGIGISLPEQSVLKMLRECYSISGKIWGAICAENATGILQHFWKNLGSNLC